MGVILVLYQWHRKPLFKSALPAERIRGSMRAGLRYIQYTPALKAAFTRLSLHYLCERRLVAAGRRRPADLHQGALGYGILNGSMGLRRGDRRHQPAACAPQVLRGMIIASSTGVFIGTLLVLALVRIRWSLFPCCRRRLCLDQHHVHSESRGSGIRAGWVQARALGAYQMVFSGGMALGSVIWGFIAEHLSTPISLCARPAACRSPSLSLRLHVLRGEQPDLSPHRYALPAPTAGVRAGDHDGPVRFPIDYCIDPRDYNDFIHAIHQLRDVRLRDGAMRWGVFQDASDPRRLNETFITESWLEYLRQRERFTASDRQIRDRVGASIAATSRPGSRICSMPKRSPILKWRSFQHASPALASVLFSPFMLTRVEASGVPAPSNGSPGSRRSDSHLSPGRGIGPPSRPLPHPPAPTR